MKLIQCYYCRRQFQTLVSLKRHYELRVDRGYKCPISLIESVQRRANRPKKIRLKGKRGAVDSHADSSIANADAQEMSKAPSQIDVGGPVANHGLFVVPSDEEAKADQNSASENRRRTLRAKPKRSIKFSSSVYTSVSSTSLDSTCQYCKRHFKNIKGHHNDRRVHGFCTPSLVKEKSPAKKSSRRKGTCIPCGRYYKDLWGHENRSCPFRSRKSLHKRKRQCPYCLNWFGKLHDHLEARDKRGSCPGRKVIHGKRPAPDLKEQPNSSSDRSSQVYELAKVTHSSANQKTVSSVAKKTQLNVNSFHESNDRLNEPDKESQSWNKRPLHNSASTSRLLKKLRVNGSKVSGKGKRKVTPKLLQECPHCGNLYCNIYGHLWTRTIRNGTCPSRPIAATKASIGKVMKRNDLNSANKAKYHHGVKQCDDPKQNMKKKWGDNVPMKKKIHQRSVKKNNPPGGSSKNLMEMSACAYCCIFFPDLKRHLNARRLLGGQCPDSGNCPYCGSFVVGLRRHMTRRKDNNNVCPSTKQ